MTERLDAIKLENMQHCGFGVDAMKKIKICTECKNQSPDSEAFCRECGHRLPDKTLYDIYKERHKTCHVCDTVVTDESDYCPQCGERIENRIIQEVTTWAL